MSGKYSHKGRVDIYQKEKSDNTGAWVLGIIVVIFLIAAA